MALTTKSTNMNNLDPDDALRMGNVGKSEARHKMGIPMGYIQWITIQGN
jgi:hypothetical protein